MRSPHRHTGVGDNAAGVTRSTNIDGGPGPTGRNTLNNVLMTVNGINLMHAEVLVFHPLLQNLHCLFESILYMFVPERTVS